MLVPDSWRKTNWNLQTAIDSSIRADDFWARSRNLRYLRHVHRLDADTSGVMLFAKSEGAMRAMGEMFESRRMEKTYLAVVEGIPREKEWACELPIGPDPKNFGKMRVDHSEEGKEAETNFRVLMGNERFTLIEASPLTGRTHQIRLHLAESGSPIMCDEIYGRVEKGFRLGLRAVRLAYKDTFTRRPVAIRAGGSLPEGIWFQADARITISEMGCGVHLCPRKTKRRYSSIGQPKQVRLTKTLAQPGFKVIRRGKSAWGNWWPYGR